MRDAVVLLAKDVDGGEVAKRFSPPFPPEAGLALAKAFLSDAIDAATGLAVDVWCSIEGDEEAVRELLPPTVRVVKSRAGSYAERLVAVADDLFLTPYRRIVIVPGDCPTIDELYLRVAFDALIGSDAVMGPALDGGYLVIGLAKPIPRLFLDIEMGTPNVLRQTLMRARDLELQMNVLPPRRGLMTLDDLEIAIAEGELNHAMHTLRVLESVHI